MPLHEAQRKIASDTHRFRVLVCGRKFGKTTLAAEEIKACAISRPNQRILYLAPTFDDARRLMWDRLAKEMRSAIIKENESRLEFKVKTIKGGSSDIFLGTWERVQNYRGDEFNFIIPDEVQDYRNFWVGWQEALRPTLSPRKGSSLFMGTPKGFTHLYDLFNNESKDDDYKSFHFTSYDNPFADPEEIAKARKELPEDQFAQEYLADFRKTQGLVYKEFDRKLHIYTDEKIPNPIETVAGIDFGFTNPCAILTITRDYDNNFWVENEWYKTEKTEDEIAEVVATRGFNKVYADPEAPSAIEVLRKRKVNLREVIKNKDSIKVGIQKVRELLKAGKLKIHSSCENLIYEFETYAYPDKKELRNENENPIKENDHALDALRYVILMQDRHNTQVKQFYPGGLNRSPSTKVAHQYYPKYGHTRFKQGT